MVDLGRNGYIKQIGIFFDGNDFQKAHDLAKEYAAKFPQDLLAHFYLAKAAYWINDYDETAKEGRVAYNQSTDPNDLLACALITAVGYYGLKQYSKGYEFLKTLQKGVSSKELEELLYSFSLAMDDSGKAVEHLTNMYIIDPKSAERIFKE